MTGAGIAHNAWDHPRTCGEKAAGGGSHNAGVGSPPHMRGKDCAFFILSPLYRITPAHAGKRARLEVMRRTGKGSPPHMRGKVNLAVCSCRQRRITPAHAGKSPRALRRPGGRRDHPRTCGEKALLFLGLPLMLGSPPHMRGKVALKGLLHITSGITPAHAGKRTWTRFSAILSGDHPRTCGEKTKKIP